MQANILHDSIPPGKNFDKAHFSFWYPENIENINGILVLVPGHNGDGRNAVNDSTWQAFAKKHDFALLGCYFKDFDHEDMQFIERYCNVKEGSGQALVDVISKFATKSNHKEIENAPLLLWGSSAGGQFNYEFACWKPERVIAFVVNKGGFYFTGVVTKETRNVPGLFLTGENDIQARTDIIKGLFAMNMRLNGVWTYAQEPQEGHGVGQTKKLALKYYNEIIPLRINANEEDATLKRIKPEAGLKGDLKTLEYLTFDEYKKSNETYVWLPNLTFAKAWLSFIKNDPF